MKIDCIIGIDPGANGGIVCWRPNHKTTAVKMPKDVKELQKYLEYIKGICSPLIFLEKLSIRPDDFVGGKMYRIQKMEANYEQLKTVITLCGIPFCMVHPLKWQNELKLRIQRRGFKEEKADRKRRYKEIAGNLYPDIKQTLWSSDATLIMHFGRYILQNNQQWVKENLPAQMYKSLF